MSHRASVLDPHLTSGMHSSRGARASVRTSVRENKIHDSKIHEIMAAMRTQEFEDVGTLNDGVNMLLESMPFQVLIASCILLNGAVIGGETDFPDLEIWHFIETAFLIIFTFELVLRLYSIGWRDFFASGEDQVWNVFDFAIVGLGLFDVLISVLGIQKKGSAGVTTIFRMIRLLRILRIFKIVRFLKQLYLLAFGFVEAAQAVFWVTVLMLFVLYICSIILVRVYGRLAESGGSSHVAATILENQFKSISISMLSLFELMSDPGNLKIYHDLMGEFPMLTAFLLSFVIFGSFGMIALLTGVISESMFEKNQMRAAEERSERECQREVMEIKIRELYRSAQPNEEGEVNLEDLDFTLPRVREMFDKFNIEYMQHDLNNIISISDTNDSGSVSEEEFVSGIMSLCDGVRAASIQEVFYLVSQMHGKMKKLDEALEFNHTALPALNETVQRLLEKFENQAPLRPASPSVPNGFDSVFHRVSTNVVNGLDSVFRTDYTEARRTETRAHLGSSMDERMDSISRQIEDLKVHMKGLCRMPTDARCREPNDKHRFSINEPLNGDNFTLVDGLNGNRISANIQCPPILPESWLDQEHSTDFMGHTPLLSSEGDQDQRIRPLSPPPAASSRSSLLGNNPT